MKYNRREIFKRAWELVRRDGIKIGVALKCAWSQEKNYKLGMNNKRVLEIKYLTQEQRSMISWVRSSIWESSDKYIRTTDEVGKKEYLEMGRSKKYYDYLKCVEDGHIDRILKCKTSTLKKFWMCGEYDYRRCIEMIVNAGYDIEKQERTDRNGKKYFRDEFGEWYERRGKVARIINMIYDELEKRGAIKQEREIVTGTYKRVMKRITKQVDGWLTGDRLDRKY